MKKYEMIDYLQNTHNILEYNELELPYANILDFYNKEIRLLTNTITILRTLDKFLEVETNIKVKLWDSTNKKIYFKYMIIKDCETIIFYPNKNIKGTTVKEFIEQYQNILEKYIKIVEDLNREISIQIPTV